MYTGRVPVSTMRKGYGTVDRKDSWSYDRTLSVGQSGHTTPCQSVECPSLPCPYLEYEEYENRGEVPPTDGFSDNVPPGSVKNSVSE